jgi:hypothetical protein
METTLISPLAVRELLLNSGWTYHPEHKVFTQFLDLELSPKFWDSARTLPSDDCNFDRLARHMGIPRDTLIEDLEQRTQRMQRMQRMHDEKLDPQKATRINSEKLFDPEVLWTEEPVTHGPDSSVETVVSALRIGIAYARMALKNLRTQGLVPRLGEHLISLIEADIREMERALELLGFKE